MLAYLHPRSNTVEAITCQVCRVIHRPCDFQRACEGVLSSIGQVCNPRTLHSLTLADYKHPGYNSRYDEDVWEVRAGRQPRNSALDDPIDITPLCNFPKLKKVDIRLKKLCVQLVPEAVPVTSTSRPSLQVLNLCPDFPCEHRLPCINHTHILQLLDSCPSLRELGLRFDATQILARDLDMTNKKRFPQPRILPVGDSPITSPSRVPAFLEAHFPQLQELHTISGAAKQDMTILQQRWVAVIAEFQGGWCMS